MKLTPVNKYLMHCSGIYTMLAWLETQEQLGTKCSTGKETIFLPILSARYFSLGTSKHKKAKLPFLCIQPNESKWFKLIQWEKAVVRQNDNHLYIISSVIKGDEVSYPDIPSFAIAIPFDKSEKLDLISSFDNIDGREYFIDTDSAIRVNFHNKIFNIPLKHLSANTPYLDDVIITNYGDLMRDKEQNLQSVFGDSEPEFKGELADVPDRQGIFNKLFRPKLENKIIKK